VAAMARSEPPARRSDGDRMGAGRSLIKGTGARSHATSTQIARNATRGEILDRRLAVDGLPGALAVSPAVPIVGMASAKKGQQARSEIGYPVMSSAVAVVQLIQSP